MNAQGTRAEGQHQMVTRLPFSLHQRLVELADEDGLSVNAKVTELVQREVKRRNGQPRKAAA